MTREIDRRSFVKTAAGTAVAATTLATAPNVFAASNKSITFTESWIPNGGSQWVRVAIANGYFKKRGIDVKVSRGFGSVASAQAVGQGKFVTAQSGIGYLISYASSSLETAMALAAIVYLLGAGLVLFILLMAFESTLNKIFSTES